MTSPRILAVGGAHIDRRGRITDAYVPGASNPGVMREDVGGGAFNALRNAVRRGAVGSLMSIRGGDAAGETVSRAIAAEGIADLSVVFLDRVTPSYTAILDRDGEVIVGFADMALYDLAFTKQMRRSKMREAVERADALLCDANLPASALGRFAEIAAGKPLFAIAISPAKVSRLTDVLNRLSCLFMNRREAAALSHMSEDAPAAATVRALQSQGLVSGVITSGSGPVMGFDGDRLFSIVPPPAPTVLDATGAGDALAGATVAAIARGMKLREALREGVAAATLAVQSRASVPAFSAQTFAATLTLVPQAVELGTKIGETS